MATNRRKGGKTATDENPEETTAVTTTEPVTESTTEPAAADTSAEDAAKAKAKAERAAIDHEGNLHAAIVTFSNDSDVAKLQEAYRAVPTAARGKVQGVAMKRAMTEGIDMDVLGAVLDAFNDLPTATKATRTKVELPPGLAGALQLSGLMIAYKAKVEELGDAGVEADAQAKVWFAEGAPDEHKDTILRLAGQANKALDKGGRGGSGERTTKTETLKDILDRGGLPAGAVLKGANDVEAVVNAEGKLETLGEVFDNPSAAARAHRIKATGKPTSTNGWDFFSYEGKPIGDLRIK